MTTLVDLIEAHDWRGLRRELSEGVADEESLNAALKAAVQNDLVEPMGLLVAHGADVHARAETGWSLLHIAVELDRIGAICELSKLGLDINVESSMGDTPLHIAVDAAADRVEQTGAKLDTHVIDLLLSLGADPDTPNAKGKTARAWADESGLPELREVFTARTR